MKEFISLERESSRGQLVSQVACPSEKGVPGEVTEHELPKGAPWDQWGCAKVSSAGAQQEKWGALGFAGEQG